MIKLRLIEEIPQRVFAIGDLHGCHQELSILLNHLEKVEGIGEQDLVVFIGDYIDRGPNSKAVVDLLIDFGKRHPQTVFLRGNHEDMLLDFLGFGGNLGGAFLHNGGVETLQQYGISAYEDPEEIAHAMPRDHFSFYLNLESYVSLADFIFVHAGLSPLRALDSQMDYDLFWIRDEFINNIHGFKKTVVFGHTPHQDVLFNAPFKIGIDTGLVFGNMLTCIELVYRNSYQIARGGNRVSLKAFPQTVSNLIGSF